MRAEDEISHKKVQVKGYKDEETYKQVVRQVLHFLHSMAFFEQYTSLIEERKSAMTQPVKTARSEQVAGTSQKSDTKLRKSPRVLLKPLSKRFHLRSDRRKSSKDEKIHSSHTGTDILHSPEESRFKKSEIKSSKVDKFESSKDEEEASAHSSYERTTDNSPWTEESVSYVTASSYQNEYFQNWGHSHDEVSSDDYFSLMDSDLMFDEPENETVSYYESNNFHL